MTRRKAYALTRRPPSGAPDLRPVGELKAIATEPAPTDPGSAAAIRRVVVDNAYSLPHVVGTCAMGTSPELGAVVDALGRVHGVSGLAVIDASIIPEPPSGFPHVITLMIAEHVSEKLAAALGRPTYHQYALTDSPIDAYLKGLPDEHRGALQRLRDQIIGLVPDAEQTMSYGMPTIKLDGKALLLFACWKAHCSVYGLTDAFMAAHADELNEYERTKGSLHFAPEAPFPPSLVEKMVRARLAELEGDT